MLLYVVKDTSSIYILASKVITSWLRIVCIRYSRIKKGFEASELFSNSIWTLVFKGFERFKKVVKGFQRF